MQVDAGTFITDIEDTLKELLGGVNEQHSSYDVIHMFTRAALATMVKHSRGVGGGLAPVPQMDDQTRSNIIKAIGTPADQAKFRERGRKAAETRARNKAAKAAATEQEKAQGQGQPPTLITNDPEHHTRRTFGGAPASPLTPSAPLGGDGGVA